MPVFKCTWLNFCFSLCCLLGVVNAQTAAQSPEPELETGVPISNIPASSAASATATETTEVTEATEEPLSEEFPSLVSFEENYPLPPYYVIEIEAGVNYYGYDIQQSIAKYGLESLSDTTALSYNVKSGIIFLEHWKTLLSFGYSKRPNFEYPLHYIRTNQEVLENHRHFRFGVEQQYLIWPYKSRFNIAGGLENAWLRRSVQVTERTNDIILTPRSYHWDEYFISPKAKFLYRISRHSTLHFSFEYHVLFPSIEHYPQLLFGIDISFFLYKPRAPKRITTEAIPAELQKKTEDAFNQELNAPPPDN